MDYTLVKKRGQGGFGIVEEVIGNDGKLYARKTLAIPARLDAISMKRRFEREVKYQSAIHHDNVVHIFEHNLVTSPPWFIMPLAICSLEDELIVDRHLGGQPKKALFDILAGLEEIHRLGYYHRDLKPGNVLKYQFAINPPYYALSDFGLMAIGEDNSSTLTLSGMGGGTPAYQAPECAINFKRATARSDIYSFGALLHDIFAPNPKRLPHEELGFPGDVGNVVAKCTKRNSHRRYKDVGQLREALFLALSTHQFQFQSGEEQIVVGILSDEVHLPNTEQWDRIFDFLDSNSESGLPVRNIFRALRLDHIDQLHTEDPDLLTSLGKMFSDHCRTLSFDFDYCDVLASKAQRFYDFGEISLKADVAVAMLKLGLDHNRWFVEWKFMQMAGVAISDNLASRILVEMGVLAIDFTKEFARMSSSISADGAALHPILRASLV